jgi:magnesium chelatase family protein
MLGPGGSTTSGGACPVRHHRKKASPRRTAVVTARPCRAPHHTISDVGLIGGRHLPMPGEVSQAHHGVRCLDELPEFRHHVLEVLHKPLEQDVP